MQGKINIYFIFATKNDTISVMRNIFTMFFIVNCCTAPLFADSFLTAQKFPKTFEDLSFSSRIEVLRDGYEPYDVEYDGNGVCVRGCAYPGITIKEDMESIDAATEEMAELIEEEIAEQQNPQYPQNPSNVEPVLPGPVAMATDWCRNGLPTSLPLRYPVDMTDFKYKISSDFGLRTSGPNGGGYLHGGLDINAPKGTPVYATADGVVERVARQDKPGGAGLFINIRHANGLITQYMHLDQALVTKGATVKACQKIATSGNSGKPKNGGAYGAHLDYRVRFQGDDTKFVDILCPCKAAKRSGAVGNYDGIQQDCAHSLFNRHYKFSNSSVKRSNWRIKYGHCMRNVNDLLPDEAR